jgi:UDP-GlcNAc3NAcA epimerase
MIMTVIGARPQFVKAAVVSRALKDFNIEEIIIHTGQHYDKEMSDIFWEELDLPKPQKNLMVGSGLHGAQTAQIITKLEKEMLDIRPQALLVYGDTNSTLAGAIVASKLNIKVIHVEAGLRSFNRTMPEEINRIITDCVSEILFCSSEEGVKQLEREGIVTNVFNVGDVMYDALNAYGPIAKNKIKLEEVLPFEYEPYILATIHRPSNTDSSFNLEGIISAFRELPYKIVWPLHPRNRESITRFNIPENVFIILPASYLEMQVLLQSCTKVCTDSGGLQKEAYWSKKPCITLRDDTEWVETLSGNWNILTGPNRTKIVNAVLTKVELNTWKELYGDGKASVRIASILKNLI